MNIEAVKMNELLSEEQDIYKTVMIVAHRARQIIDKRYLEQVDLEDIEDSDQLIELSKEDFDKMVKKWLKMPFFGQIFGMPI